MKHGVRTLSALFAVAALALALPAGASTFLAVSREELVSRAEAVVLGRVVEVSSFWNREHTAILTEATFEVEDTVVGVAPTYLTLRTFGGRVGNYIIEAHGFPRFVLGEKLLLFLEPEHDGAHKVLGYLQGQYRVRNDTQGRPIAEPLFDAGARILRPDGTFAPAPRPQALAELRNELRAIAGRVGRPAVR
jgi:hypothetical protein